MMSAETLAYSTLISNSEVTDIVDDRVYPDVIPERIPLPAIAISRMDTDYVNTIHGKMPPAFLVHLEIWCMSESRAAAEALADVAEEVMAESGDFFMENRRPEFDPDRIPPIWSSVLSAGCWQ